MNNQYLYNAHAICLRSYDPNLVSKLLYTVDQDFLNIVESIPFFIYHKDRASFYSFLVEYGNLKIIQSKP